MLLEKSRSKASIIPTGSLADIAFLLIVFFLVTTTIDVDKGLDLVLPGKEEIPVRPTNIVNILINAQDKVMLDLKNVELQQISDIIKTRLLQNSNLIASIKTDYESSYGMYIKEKV